MVEFVELHVLLEGVLNLSTFGQTDHTILAAQHELAALGLKGYA